ncbi:MAG: hypothetical protein JRG94_15460 [Deltaproteobacteria bacterium]|nr:hypothetical protein [Deltaproteobacteria bacterium]
MDDVKPIQVWTDTEEPAVRAAVPSLTKAAARTVEVSATVLAESLSRVLMQFDKVLTDADSDEGPFSIRELELNLAVNASGGVELIGKLSSSVATSIRVVLSRRSI